ncbi:ADP-ribose pyrophosphatase [Brevibacterium sanguinis]|uniref:ADP-ribose pyrophosphatase n=2 Tax=Brevibacterium TaxID=1696 RepID=A0A366ICU9_9MICO|nr:MULTISPECIES: NUDIX hydrolase [Brevibacterium]RBP61886.1 ADP-ribose pyrophosphatase [Brevibacterium sanguinis]RBP68668.1 ADP-ribose pyrophosphatase [Brevibacterium celere]
MSGEASERTPAGEPSPEAPAHGDLLRDEVHHPEVTASEVVFHGAVWDIRRETFDLPEAHGLVRDMMDHTGAVGVACVDEQERILLIKQYRHPVRARLWEVPAGLLDVAGEDPLAAAQRELAEEADLRAARWEVLSDSCLSPGGSSESIRLYLARDLEPVAEEDLHVRSDEEAGLEFRWVSIDEALAAIAAGALTNAAAQLAILQVATVLRCEAEGRTAPTRPADAPRLLID